MKQHELKELVKAFVKNFSLLFTECSLYPTQHPNVISQVKQAFTALREVLQKVEVFYVDILEEQFVFDGVPLYEIKHVAEKTTQLLAAKEIKSMCFKRAVTPQELIGLAQLVLDKTKTPTFEALEAAMKKAGISSIVLEKVSPEDKEDRDFLLPIKIYGSNVEANKLVFGALQSGKKIPMDVVEKVAQEITDMIANDSASSIALASLRNYDEYTFTHSANVAILSVALAATIFNDTAFLNQLAKAAILHDIGKAVIPLEILNKPEKLTEEEWKIMRHHPLSGVEILERQEGTDKLATIITAQHHMKYDLSGYPTIKGLTQLHPLSLIVNIVDTYDAITSKRPYREPSPPDKVLAIMMKLIGADFEPHFFKIFTHMMGIYPPGSFVRLNTKEVAISRRIFPQALLLPEIKIVMNAAGELLEEPFILNLSNKEKNLSNRYIKEVIDPLELGIDPIKFL